MWYDLIRLWRQTGTAIQAPDAFLGTHSHSVDKAYGSGKHVIATDAGWDDLDELTAWCKENGCQCFWDRVIWDKWMQRWSSNGIGGGDYLFIQASDEETAMVARMVWGLC